MKSISSILSGELRYQLSTRYLLLAVVSTVLVSSISLFGVVNKATSSIALFERTLESSAANGITLQQALDTPVNVTSENGMNTVDNVLRFDFENAVRAIDSLAPASALIHALEFLTFIIFPALFAIYGILVATYDERFKTARWKVIRFGWPATFTAKAVSVGIAAAVTLALSLPLILGLAWLVRTIFGPEVPAELVGADVEPAVNGLMPALGVALVSCLFFGLVGYTLGTLFRNPAIPLIGFLAVNFIAPIAFAFDPRNLMSVLGHQAFTFDGMFQLVQPREVATVTAALALTAILAGLLVLAWFVSSRRSHYVS